MPSFEIYKALYYQHSKLLAFKKKIEKAKNIIEEAYKVNGDWFIAYSGGKDSTVMLHLITQLLKIPIPIHTYLDDLQIPGIKEYIQKISKLFNVHINIDYYNHFENLKGSNVNVCETIRRNRKIFFDDIYWKRIEELEKKYKGVFLGLRREESLRRAYNYKVRGYLYKKKNNNYVCTPIIYFTGKDIFAYFLKYNIPIWDIYTKCDFIPPHKIRQTWFLPGKFASQGQLVWLKRYYPNVYFKLQELCPEVNSYV